MPKIVYLVVVELVGLSGAFRFRSAHSEIIIALKERQGKEISNFIKGLQSVFL